MSDTASLALSSLAHLSLDAFNDFDSPNPLGQIIKGSSSQNQIKIKDSKQRIVDSKAVWSRPHCIHADGKPEDNPCCYDKTGTGVWYTDYDFDTWISQQLYGISLFKDTKWGSLNAQFTCFTDESTYILERHTFCFDLGSTACNNFTSFISYLSATDNLGKYFAIKCKRGDKNPSVHLLSFSNFNRANLFLSPHAEELAALKKELDSSNASKQQYNVEYRQLNYQYLEQINRNLTGVDTLAVDVKQLAPAS